MRGLPRTTLRTPALAAGSVVAAAVMLAGCGSKAGETEATKSASCVDTSRAEIKVGSLNSLSGTMAISEVTVRDADQAGHRRDQRRGRRARQADRARRRGRRVRLADVRREGREADHRRQGRRRVRRLDVGQPQGDAAGVRGPQRAAVLPGAVRGPGGVAEHLLHRRHDQPADRPGARLPEGAGR